MSIKIYISPSTQEHNAYHASTGKTEEYWMNILADGLMRELFKYSGLLVDMGHGSMTLGEMIKASNKFGADIHLALHTNAANGQVLGTEAFAPTTNDKFGLAIYSAVAQITPSKDRGLKDGNHLAEIKQIQAPHRCLLEIDFHDNAKGAAWIATNINMLKDTLAAAILGFLEVEYKFKPIKKESLNPVENKDAAVIKSLVSSIDGVLITDTDHWEKVLKGEIVADPKYLRVIFTRCKALITEFNIPKRL